MKTSHEFEAGHDGAIEREAEELFAHLWRRFRLKPFPCYERPHKGQQRDMAARRQPEFQSPGLRHVRVELDLVAERVQFPRQIEDVKAPARGDRNPQRLGHGHLISPPHPRSRLAMVIPFPKTDLYEPRARSAPDARGLFMLNLDRIANGSLGYHSARMAVAFRWPERAAAALFIAAVISRPRSAVV